MKIALIVSKSPGQLVLFSNMAQILSKKYDVHLYLLTQAPGFLSRFFAWLTRSPLASSSTNPKKKVNSQTALVYRAYVWVKSASGKLLLGVPHSIIYKAYLFILSFYIAFKFDLVISHDIHWTGAISTFCAKMFRKKSIIFVVGNYVEELKIRHKGISGVLTLKVLSISEFMSIHLADGIVSDYKVADQIKRKRTKTVVSWGKLGMVDIQQFRRDDKIKEIYRRKLGIPNADLVLLFVGWLTEWDAADTALNVYRALPKKAENLWLVFIGSGALEEHIEKTIIEEKLGKVKLVGFIPHAEIHNYMMAGDIGLMPAKEPQCGIGAIPLELMALGIPIVATDVGSLREVIIDGETGFLVKDDVVEEMAQRINLLLENPDLLGKMRANAQKMIEEEFAPESVSTRVFSLIGTCLNS